MKILLTKDVAGLGRTGDIKDVSDGHARNFLLPKGFGVVATPQIVTKTQKESQEKQDKASREEDKLNHLVTRLSKAKLTIISKASKEHLFAAIHETELVHAISKQLGIEIDPHKIVMNKPIKTIGTTPINIKLGPKHQALITVEVKANES